MSCSRSESSGKEKLRHHCRLREAPLYVAGRLLGEDGLPALHGGDGPDEVVHPRVLEEVAADAATDRR
jgi:hypothetical protein